MMMLKILLFVLLSTASFAFAQESQPETLANKLNLSAASKAMVQWERVFKSKRKMKRYKIDTLKENEKAMLKKYLIDHAIDSDQPTIAGV